MKSLEDAAYSSGANPSEWYGKFTPIKEEDWVKIEVIRNGKWVEYPVKDLE